MEPIRRRSRQESTNVRNLILEKLQQGQKMPQIRKELNLTMPAAWKQLFTLKRKLPPDEAKKIEQLLAKARTCYKKRDKPKRFSDTKAKKLARTRYVERKKISDAKATKFISLAKVLMKGEASLLPKGAYNSLLFINGKIVPPDAENITALTKHFDLIAEKSGLSLPEKAVFYAKILKIKQYQIAKYLGESNNMIILIFNSVREKIKKSGNIK